MVCGRLEFRTIGYQAPHPGKDALEYDAVILVGDNVELLEAGRLYREYGVNVYYYPLSPRDSPTIFSLLGIAGFIVQLASSECKSVLVEGFGSEKLVEYTLYLIGILRRKPQLAELQSPLHARSVYVLERLAQGGVDLKNEAMRNIQHAFTGGDAHKSDIVEHSVDIIASLPQAHVAGFEGCPADIYRCVSSGRCSLGRVCEKVMGVAESFDYSNTGAVKCVALVPGERRVYVGCRMLSSDECLPEVERGYLALKRLLLELGLPAVEGYTIVSPEEAACILYGERMRYPCAGEGLL